MKTNKIVIAALALTLSLAGCTNLGSTAFTLPQAPAPTNHPDVLTTFRLSRIEIAEDEACPFDSDGKLMVFSQTAYASADGKTLTIGQDVIKVGDDFTGLFSRDLPDGYECGGRTLPAKHVLNAQITKETKTQP